MQETRLAPGFNTIDEAVKLIQSDTRKEPTVDMSYLIRHLKWCETGRNFRIPMMRRLSKEEFAKREEDRRARGRYQATSEFEDVGSMNVYINTNFDRELLRKVIRDKYREEVGHDFEEAIGKATSTVASDAQGLDAVQPHRVKGNTKVGASIGSGELTETNGKDLNV